MKNKFSFIMLLCLAACGGSNSGPGTTGGSTGGSTGGNSGNNDEAATTPGPQTRFIGRTMAGPGGTLLSWSGSSVQTRFTGTSINVYLNDNATSGYHNRVSMVVDGTAQEVVLDASKPSYPVTASGSGDHTLTVVKETEAGVGDIVFVKFDGATQDSATAIPNRSIEFVGDSITAGYGDLADANSIASCAAPSTLSVPADPNFESALDDYSLQTANMLKADWSVVAYSGKGVSRNRPSDTNKQLLPDLYGLVNPLDATSTYDFKAQPDAVVIDLGTNDFALNTTTPSASVPDQASFTAAYGKLVSTIQSKYPKAHIFLCLGPMLSDYYPGSGPNGQGGTPLKELSTSRTYIQAVQAAAGGDAKNVHFVEFPPNQEADYGCDDHPNKAKQATMATLLSASIQQYLGWK